MIRTITVVSVFLLTTGSVAYAGDNDPSFRDPGSRPGELEFQPPYFHRVDMNVSPREYEETYRHNRKMVSKTLRSYSKSVLRKIGIPEQGGYLMGAALGLAINHESGLDLNKSKTLALEFKDVDKSDRSLYFKFKLDW
ncbi:MAG: hypothetical protein LJE75_04735 [Gammaproteobacteria bacterium]|jgi:hypothetical protein|nr:hypothetical protein [Gammaproteobacteria bacterium]